MIPGGGSSRDDGRSRDADPSRVEATFGPSTVAVIFSSTRTTDDDAGYEAMAHEMVELAALQDGYLGIESARDPHTRRGITVSYWRDEAAARAWKTVAEHREAQRLGRERWYADWRIEIATVTRAYGSSERR